VPPTSTTTTCTRSVTTRARQSSKSPQQQQEGIVPTTTAIFGVVNEEETEPNTDNHQELPPSVSYQDTDVSSKGLVSSLTNLVNLFSGNSNKSVDKTAASEGNSEITTTTTTTSGLPPQTPQELLERIREDYQVRNYLWTGKIDLTAFDKKCRFTDPTLSFEGTDQFTKNLDNLVPIVEALTEPGDCESILLDISLHEGYVQTRWNMVGRLSGLPWKPRIDVIGRTKFWYQPIVAQEESPNFDNDLRASSEGVQVYFYDEEWEIPAAKALLQLVTPAGTIRNSNTA